MKNSLPYLSALALAAAATAAIAQRDPHGETVADVPRVAVDRLSSAAAKATSAAGELSVGDRLVLQAIGQLERRESLVARLNCWVSVNGVESDGGGNYWQQGRDEDRRVRLELKMRSQDARLLQIANERFLWVDLLLPTGRSVTHIDLRALRTDPVLAEGGDDAIGPDLAAASTMAMEWMAHSGGLPSLLASLHNNFTFLPPQAMRLEFNHSPEENPTQVPVFAVVGHWRPERLAALLAAESPESRVKGQQPVAESQATPALDSLPERFPQEVLLLVGQADLVPYRVEYRRLETPLATDGTAPMVAYQLSAKPLVVLELTDVKFDVAIAAGQFDYAPGSANSSDQTPALLERLRRERLTR